MHAGANTVIALLAKIRRWLIQLYLAYTSDNKLITKILGLVSLLIIYRFKRGFLWGMYKKGARSFVGENLKKLDGTVISVVMAVAMVPSRRNRSKDQSSSVWTEL